MSKKKDLSLGGYIFGFFVLCCLFYLIGDWQGVVVVTIVFGIIPIIIALVRYNGTRQEPIQSNTHNLDPSKPGREPIPSRVRMYVWQRDQGRCAKCGSNEKLHYDHIIPLSKGGSNTDRNLQLLCESCNLSKGAKIGG